MDRSLVKTGTQSDRESITLHNSPDGLGGYCRVLKVNLRNRLKSTFIKNLAPKYENHLKCVHSRFLVNVDKENERTISLWFYLISWRQPL